MGWFDDIFGAKQSQTTQQSGTSDTRTQNNYWNDPNFQNFLKNYNSQLGNISQASAGPNQYQIGAANNQVGATNYLMPGFNAANNVAGTGISTADINRFMNPYNDQVVAATQADFNAQNARSLAGQQASMAKAGALTGSQRAGNRAIGEENLSRVQSPIIANLRSQGFNTAAGLAGQSAGLQLQGAGALGNLTNTYTGANTGLGNLGQNIWQAQYANTRLPYDLYNLGLQGQQVAGQLAGQTSNTQTTGTSNTQGVKTDSPFDIGMDLLGGAFSIFKADGGSVQARMAKPTDKPFHDKVMDAFHAVHNMRKLARGGPVMPRYEDGGGGPYGDWNMPAPNGSEANPSPSVMPGAEQGGFQKWLGDRRQARANRPADKGMDLGAHAGALSQFLSSMQRPVMGAADGAAIWDGERPIFEGRDEPIMPPSYSGVTREPEMLETRDVMPRRTFGDAYVPPLEREAPVAPPAEKGGSWWPSWPSIGLRRDGAIAGQEFTPQDRTAAILSGMGRGRVRDTLMGLQKARMSELEAEREAGRLLGTYRGRPTMDSRRLAQERDIALGAIPGRGPTLEAMKLAETARHSDKPVWGVTHHDQYGVPQYGLIDVNKAMPPRAPGALPSLGVRPPSSMPAPAAGETPRSEAVPPTRVAGGPEDRDPSAPWGSERNPAFTRDPSSVPSGTYYTTPEKPWPPSLKPPADGAPVSGPGGLPPGVVRGSSLGPNRGSPELTGEEFLATLDPADRIRVKNIAAGLEPFPTGMAAQKGRGAFLAQAVAQYDPSFDVRNYQMRQKTVTSFNAGPLAEQVKSLNTVAGHLDDMLKSSEKLNNFRYFPGVLNPAYNAIRGQISPDYQKAAAGFEANASAVAAEMAKVFRASGMSRADFEDWSKLLKDNASPETIKGAVEKAVHLIDSRMSALQNQWREGMGEKIPFTKIEPKTVEIFKRLRGEADDWGKGAAPIHIKNEEDYAKLPSGTVYIDPKGVQRTKR